MRTAEAYMVEFGGTTTPVGSFELDVPADVKVRLHVNPAKDAMLVTIGSCRLHGTVEGMAEIRNAFEFGVSELKGLRPSIPTSTKIPACADCNSEHYASEPCADMGTVTLHSEAYKIAHKYHMLEAGMAELFVDSAALWVKRGDQASVVAARRLLRLFASADDAETIIQALVEVYRRDGAWVLDSVEPVPDWKRPSATPLPVGDTAPLQLPAGPAETD